MISKHGLAKGALAMAITAASCAAYANHSWNNYHWPRTAAPVNLQVIDSTTADWSNQLNTAVSQWSQSADLTLTIVSSDGSDATRSACPAVDGMIRVCNYAYGNTGWLGLASINLDSGGHISLGTAQMNDSYASTFNADPNESYHVMCQEVGHTFGLGHTSEDGSSQGTCMDYSQDPSSTAPNQHDYDELDIIYGHFDSYDIGGSPTGFPAAALSAEDGGIGRADGVRRPGESRPLGVLVHRGQHTETYVAPDERGGLWITRVTLAPGFEHASERFEHAGKK